MSVGGSGGGGGTGGQVDIVSGGSITTSGDAAYGILAQSVGGGGGIGGIAQNQQTVDGHLAVNLGGSNSVFSPGGAVTVSVSGSIATAGREAHAVLAQSIGGGGGLITIEQAGAPSATSLSPELAEAEQLASSILTTTAGIDDPAQLSGVTGSSYFPAPTLGLTLGGSGGGGGDGGNVVVNVSGAISTTGNNALAILAQSIDGGGGAGASTRGGGALQLDQSLGLGGSGGNGGQGGAVRLNFGGNASIHTSGTGAAAIVLQSIGGGGGYAGSFSKSLWRTSGAGYVIDALGGTAGNGGPVSVQMTDAASRLTIATTGENAHGIVAQSLGGGGGLAADEKGLIIVPSTAPSSTPRENATGATGGPIDINTSGTITATGSGAIGIYAQSGFLLANTTVDPRYLGGNITIAHQGDIQGGSGPGGAAIRIDGGGQNTITLSGGSVGAASGTAVIGSFGNEVLINGGVLTGNVLLDGGKPGEFNKLINGAGATFVAGGQIAIGAQGYLKNDGIMSLGRPNSYGAVALTGDFSQSNSGTLIVHADFKGARASALTVSGQAALGGTVRVDLADPAPSPGLPILTSTIGTPALSATAKTSMLVYSYGLEQQTNTVRLNLNANFLPTGASLNGNQRALASHLQSEWNAGAYDPKYAAFARVVSVGAYYRALNQLSPEGSAVPAANKAQTSQTFMNNMMSCPDFAGSDTEFVERDCTWLRAIGSWTNQANEGEPAGYKATGVTYQLGGQKNLGSGWILGASAAYGRTWSLGNGGLSSSGGESVDVGAALKYQLGNWLFAAAIDGSYGWYANRRQISFDEAGRVAQGASRLTSASLCLRAGKQFTLGPAYLRPYADLDMVYTRSRGYRETGADLYNLRLMPASQVTVLGSPMLEVGGRIDPGYRVALRPYAALGVTFQSNDGFRTAAHFLAQPDQISTFVTTTHVPGIYGNVVAGLDILQAGGLEIKSQYSGKIAAGFLAQEATLRVGYKF